MSVPEHVVEFRGSGPEHLPEIGPAETALVAATGLAHEVVEGPAVLARHRLKRRERHPAADAAGDLNGRHGGNIERKEEGTWD